MLTQKPCEHSSLINLILASLLAGAAPLTATAEDVNARTSPQNDISADAQGTPSKISDGGQQASTNKSGDAQLEEVLVTARRRDERLQDVPAAISVVSGLQLERTSTSTMEGLGTQIPQVMFSKGISGAGSVITIRGVGTNTTSDTSVEQAVSFNVDGVSSARGRLFSNALFDLSDVQVLKGPQALYFGKNSPGGVVVVQSNDPGDHLDGYITSGYEAEAQEFHIEGAVGGPITDTLGVRLALYRSDMDEGYIHNIAGPVAAADSADPYDKANGINLPGASYEWGPGVRQTMGRLTLLFKPNTDFSARLKFTAADYRDNSDASSLVYTSCAPGASHPVEMDLGGIVFTGSPAIVTDPFAPCSKSRDQSVGALPEALARGTPEFGDGQPFLWTRSYLSSLELNYNVGPVKITSQTGYFNERTSAFNCFDLTAYCIIANGVDQSQQTWTEEIRLATQLDGPLNFVFGSFYSHDEAYLRNADALMRSVDAVTSDLASFRTYNTSTGHSISGVGEVIWKITPEIELDAGARYGSETKSAVLSNTYVQPGLPSELNIALPQGQSIPISVTQARALPQATLSWKPSADATLFVGYRTGNKSGGPASPELIPAAATAANESYKQETASGYEIGVKANAMGGRLTGDLTIYDYRFKNLQVAVFDNTTASTYIRNAGEATTDGIEGSLNFRATDALSIHGAVGYNRAYYNTFDAIGCWSGQTVAQGCNDGNQSLTGRTLPRAPKISGSIGFTWDQPVSDSLAVEFSVDGRYSSWYNTSTTLSPYAVQNGYGLLDAGFRLHNIGDKWDLSVIGKNITDKYYVTFSTDPALSASPGSQYGLLGYPRTVTLQTSYHF